MADFVKLVTTVEDMPPFLQQKFPEAEYCGSEETDLKFAALLGTIELCLTFSPRVLENGELQSIREVQDLKNLKAEQPVSWAIHQFHSFLYEKAQILDLGEKLAYIAQYPPRSIDLPGGLSSSEALFLSKFSQKMTVKITIYTVLSKSKFVPLFKGVVPCIYIWKHDSGYFLLHYQSLQTALQAMVRTSEGCKVAQGCSATQEMPEYSPTLLQTQMNLTDLKASNTRLLAILSSFAHLITTLRKDDKFVSDANLIFLNRGRADVIEVLRRIEKFDPEFPTAEYLKQLELLKFSPGLICGKCKEKVGVEFLMCQHGFCRECWKAQSGSSTEVKKCPICRHQDDSIQTQSSTSAVPLTEVCPACQKTRTTDQFVDSPICIFCAPQSAKNGTRARCEWCQKFSHVDGSRPTCLSKHFLCEDCYAQSVVMKNCVKCMNVSMSAALCSQCEKGPYEQILLKKCKGDDQICLDCVRTHAVQTGERLMCERCSQAIPDEKLEMIRKFQTSLSINAAVISENSAPPPDVSIMLCTKCQEVIPTKGIKGEELTKVMCAMCNTVSIVP